MDMGEFYFEFLHKYHQIASKFTLIFALVTFKIDI